MGVPSFYRWLVNKYPKIVRGAVEEDKGDYCSTNPNGIEFDNFYLDMNGIIHPCFHPEDNLFPPTTFNEVFSKIYEYIDRLFNIVRPRKLLFLAIDGVAPRAKMNQQRARRFRTAKDIQLSEEMEEKLRNEFEREGKVLLPKEESQVADSNVITPGTEFMHMLSNELQSYITLRMSENAAWQNIKVILSDDNVPGEGEHKIMSFIRAQRSSPGYDPNTTHCLYGLDADLIMLALATHEIHFSILREEVLSPGNQPSNVTTLESSIDTHSLKFEEKSSSESAIESKKKPSWPVKKKQPYQFLHVWVLREYLALDMEITSTKEFEYDLERIIDDFIFICFFAGNDFLPHIPSLAIHEGCLDLLMHVYKKEIQNLGGYLVDMQEVEDKKGGYIKFKRVERYALMVGSYEEKIFSKRSQLRERKLRRILAEYRDVKETENNDIEEGRGSDIVCSVVADANEELEVSVSPVDNETVLNNTKELKQKLKDYIRNESDLFKDGSLGTDKVKFGSPGWRERYYQEKFSVQSAQEIEATRKDVVAKYGEGLCWVLLYYFSGVPSWNWFYPYHYGPLASDFKGFSQTRVKFQKGVPFKPFDQLMGVLPPRSAHALPSVYKGLMTDENSNIIDFYPTEFETDIDGKRFMWQGISKLPFIEEERLLTETKQLENELKDYEKMRNLQSLDRLFVRCLDKESRLVLQGGIRTASKKLKDAVMMDSTLDGIKGTIHLMLEDLIEGTIHLMLEDLIEADDDNGEENYKKYLCVFYEINPGFQNVPRLLERVNIPEKTINEDDIIEAILWHDTNNCNRFQDRRPILEQKSDNSNFQSHSSPAFRGDARGFTLGRGRSPSGQMSSGSSSSLDYGARVHHQPCVAKSEYNEKSGVGFSGRSYYGGFRGLRISDSSTRPVSNFGQVQSGNNFRPSGRGWQRNHPAGAGPPPIVDAWQTNHVPGAGPAPIVDAWRRNHVPGAVPAPNVDTWRRNVPGAGPAPIVWHGNHVAGAGPAPIGDTWQRNNVLGAGRAPTGNAWRRNVPGACPAPIVDAWRGNHVVGARPAPTGDTWQRNHVPAAASAPTGNAWRTNVPAAGRASIADPWHGNHVAGAGRDPVVDPWPGNQVRGAGQAWSTNTGRGRGRGRGWGANRD